ncbi:MAG: hypothetical protein M1122_02605 [Candidatus Marsarchaeota archaeon]|jgi:hypothetical protein|nr:hypothetical protein [Candidatus Marsarchaeota archaeon]
MISGIVTSLDEKKLLVTPSSDVELSTLVGKKAQYVDKTGKIWPGVVSEAEDPFVIIKFDEFPSGIGQGQIVDILEDGDA